MSLKEKLNKAIALANSRAHLSEGRFDGLTDDVRSTFGLRSLDESGEMMITAIVTSFIALAIVIAIGVIILSSVQTAMPAVNESSPYYALQASLETTTVSGYGLVAIVIIIVAAAAIMYAIRMISQ